VLTADHTNELTLPEYTNSRGLYQVPVAFFHPHMEAERRPEVASQTDIMPSVLNYLGYDEPYFAFGEDILTRRKAHPYAVCYNAPLFQIFSDSLLLQFDGEKTIGLYELKDYKMERNLLDNAQQKEEMERKVKAIVQQYMTRMIDNRLVP
jgi:membrane-anchored protein YejM (alkaline phosphatase superfamily)